MADDAGISDGLLLKVYTSIDDLFDRIIDSFMSTLVPPEGEKWNFIANKQYKENYKKMLVAKLKEKYEEKIRVNTEKQFKSILSRIPFDRKNIEKVIDYVCKFVKKIEIQLTDNKKTINAGAGLVKDTNIRELVFSLSLHDCIGKYISIDEDLYCPAQLVFDNLFSTFIDVYRIFILANKVNISFHITIKYVAPSESDSKVRSYYENEKKCDEYNRKLHQASETRETLASQGGAKSRRIRRRKHNRKTHRKHARKTHHKRASKSHKRSHRSRAARKHKKHTHI